MAEECTDTHNNSSSTAQHSGGGGCSSTAAVEGGKGEEGVGGAVRQVRREAGEPRPRTGLTRRYTRHDNPPTYNTVITVE